MSWPDDFRPGLNCDAQSEINRQLGTDCDIYLGVLGSRFGSATPRSASGTQEEFEAAVKRFRQDPTSIRVLFYFKRGGEDPFALDVEQLQMVRRFREGLGAQGVLFKDFADTGEFTQRVREHLDALIIDEWKDGTWVDVAGVTREPPADDETQANSVVGPITDKPHPDDEADDDELGLLEYIAAFHEAVEGISEVMAVLGAETQRVGEKTSARSSEVDRLREDFEQHKNVGGSRHQQHFVAQNRAIIDQAAEDLNEFVRATAPRIYQYRTHNRALFQNYRRAFVMPNDLGPRDTGGDRTALAGLVAATTESREKVMGFQASVSALPALTGRFKRSRRRTAALLGELVAEMSFTITEASTVLKDMGGDPDNPT